MADAPTTPAVPGATVTATTTAPAPDPAANAAFAEMRTKLAAAEKAQADLQARLTEMERKDLDEKQLLKLQLDEATKKLDEAEKSRGETETLRNTLGQFTTKLQAEYDAAIASLPAEKQDAVKALTAHVPLEDRIAAVRNAASLIGLPATVVGTVTKPGASVASVPGAPEPAKPLSPDELKRMSWGNAVKAQGPARSPAEDIAKLVEEQVAKQLAAQTAK